jgi:hypothetical protein
MFAANEVFLFFNKINLNEICFSDALHQMTINVTLHPFIDEN